MAATWKKLLYSDDTSGLGITRITNLYDEFIGGAGNLTMTGMDNTAFGYEAFINNTTGNENVAIGVVALKANTEGSGNTAIGVDALLVNTIGINNVALGFASLAANTIGEENIAVGVDALKANTEGNSNVALGFQTLYKNTTGSRNIAIGDTALYTNITGSGNIALGYYAGAYELGSNAFYVNNQDRTNTAGDKTKSLLYGTFNATAASQTLTVNGQLINNNVSITGGAITGITDLAVADGGTGLSTLTAGYIPFGAGTSPFASDAGLFWDNTNKRLGIGTATPSFKLHIYNPNNVNADLYFMVDNAYSGTASFFSLRAVSSYVAAVLTGSVNEWVFGMFGSGSFIIRDNTNTKVPVTIEALTPTNALYLQATTGNVGLGTATPSGQLSAAQANGQQVFIHYLTELTTIAAAAYTETTIQIPINTIVLGVDVRVTVTIPTAATFTVISSTIPTTFNTVAVGASAGSTDKGNLSCPYNSIVAQKIRITPNIAPLNNSGRVRVTIHYLDITPATS